MVLNFGMLATTLSQTTSSIQTTAMESLFLLPATTTRYPKTLYRTTLGVLEYISGLPAATLSHTTMPRTITMEYSSVLLTTTLSHTTMPRTTQSMELISYHHPATTSSRTTP